MACPTGVFRLLFFMKNVSGTASDRATNQDQDDRADDYNDQTDDDGGKSTIRPPNPQKAEDKATHYSPDQAEKQVFPERTVACAGQLACQRSGNRANNNPANADK